MNNGGQIHKGKIAVVFFDSFIHEIAIDGTGNTVKTITNIQKCSTLMLMRRRCVFCASRCNSCDRGLVWCTSLAARPTTYEYGPGTCNVNLALKIKANRTTESKQIPTYFCLWYLHRQCVVVLLKQCFWNAYPFTCSLGPPFLPYLYSMISPPVGTENKQKKSSTKRAK